MAPYWEPYLVRCARRQSYGLIRDHIKSLVIVNPDIHGPDVVKFDWDLLMKISSFALNFHPVIQPCNMLSSVRAQSLVSGAHLIRHDHHFERQRR